MDVRCEKCQTEYELDESRLKPGGVTVKCTNCGHMFKIRKRSNTNVGVKADEAPTTKAPPKNVDEAPTTKAPPKVQTPPAAMPVVSQPAPVSDRSRRGDVDAPVNIADMPSGPASASAERQWLVRLENGEQKTCRELATLQQWIVAGVVSRESLISRSGKTWKRLGDISELGQYFVIADEAKAARSVKPTGPTGKGGVAPGTMLGVGALRPSANPGDDDLEQRTTGNFRARQPTPPPPPPVTSSAPKANPMAQTELAPTTGPTRRPPTEPPPPPKPRTMEPPPGRATAAWASNDIKASESMAAMPQGPRGGKLSASPDEPAFAGRVRVQPSDRSTFDGKVINDDEDDFYPQQRGSRAGMWIALVSLLIIGAAAGAVYMFVFKGGNKTTTAAAPKDAGAGSALATADANAVVVAPIIDAQETPANPLDAAHAELVAGVLARMKSTLDGLSGKDDPESLAMRARLMTAMAQEMNDRAGFVDKAEADKLRKDAKQTVVDAAPLAQRAQGAQADSVSANLAMADVMRLQAKPAPSVKKYITAAKNKAGTDKDALASIALSEAQLAIRDGKLADATTALGAVAAPADDMRIKLALALIAYAQAKPADAKAQVDQILATQPDHDAANAMYKKLETTVASTDPLPPDEGSGAKAGSGSGKTTTPNENPGGNSGGGGDSYDALLAKANKLAETNCGAAKPIYDKALSIKTNGVEALTGEGYCHLDAKEFSSAFSKFRAALLVSPRYEPALGGIAETYQRQGNKPAAIEAWNKYLEVFPGSPKAKKQLEILGADSGDTKPAGGGDTKPAGGGDTGGGDTKPAGGGDTKPAGSDSAPAPAPGQ